MKAFVTVPIALAAVAASFFISQLPGAQDDAPRGAVEEKKVHWYLVDQDQGVDLAGYSDLAPGEVAGELGAGKYLCLQDYRSMDANGKWTAAKGSRLEGTIFIRPTLVRSFQEITGDPLKWSAAVDAGSPPKE